MKNFEIKNGRPRSCAIMSLLIVVLSLAGCGGGDFDAFQSYPLSEPRTTANFVSGVVQPGRIVTGGEAVAQTLGGQELAHSPLTESGKFYFPNASNFPEQFRVAATLQGTEVALFADVDTRRTEFNLADPADRGQYVVVNIPTTLASLYRQSNPGATLEDAEARTRSVLGIRPDVNIGHGIEESARNDFSHIAFFLEAAKNGGVEAFGNRLLQEMSTANQSTGMYRRFALRREHLSSDFSGLDPELIEFLVPLQRVPTLELGVITDGAKKVLGAVGGEIATSVLDAGISTAWTKFAESTGLNFGTTVALDEIEADLGIVLDELVDISNQISNQTYNDDVNSLAQNVAFLEALSSDGAGGETTAINSDGSTTTPAPSNLANGQIYEPYGISAALSAFENAKDTVPLNQPTLPPTAVQGLTDAILGTQVATALTAISDAQSTTTQKVGMNELWRQNRVDAVLNTSVNANQANFPVRSNGWIDIALQNYNYYSRFQNIAAMWLAEQARVNGNDLGTQINAIIPTVQSVAADVRKQRLSMPLHLISDKVLVDYNAGVMWYLDMQAPATAHDAFYDAYDFTLSGTAPDGSQITLRNWRTPNLAELEFLQDRARYCTAPIPSNDTPAAVNSDDGVGDFGRTTQGLQRLGFTNVANCFNSSENGGSPEDGGMWYNGIGQEDGNWYIEWQFEKQINHQHGSSQEYKSNTDDKRPYLIVRTLGKPVLDPTYTGGLGVNSSFNNIDYGSTYPYPYQDFKPSNQEIVNLGVVTTFNSAGGISLTHMGASLEYVLSTGGNVTIGDSSSSTSHSNGVVKQGATVSTFSGSQLNGLADILWWNTGTSSPNPDVTISNYPPNIQQGDGQTLVEALNAFGAVGSLIFNLDQGIVSGVPFTVSTVGYGDSFPEIITLSQNINQDVPSRNVRVLEVTPRNRLYDNRFPGYDDGEIFDFYGATLFFDTKTLESVTSQVQWELLDANGNLFVNPDPDNIIAEIKTSGADIGRLEIHLDRLAEDTEFKIRATVTVSQGTFSNTVKFQAISES